MAAITIGKETVHVHAMNQSIVVLRHTSDKAETLPHHVHGRRSFYIN